MLHLKLIEVKYEFIFNIQYSYSVCKLEKKLFGLSSAWAPHPCISHASRACKLVCSLRLLTVTCCDQTFSQTNPRTEHPFVFFLAGCRQRAKYLSHTQCICCASISLCYILSKCHYLIEAKTIKNNSLKP